MKNRRPFVFLYTLFTAIISMSVFMLALKNGWFGEAVGVGKEFCEAPHSGLIKQPVNTWSNVGFIVAGLVMSGQLTLGSFRNNFNCLTQSLFYGTFFSCITVLLAPGSMALHATASEAGGFFDMLSMYLIASFTLAYAIQRFFSGQAVHFTIVYILSLSLCIWADFQDYHLIFSFFGDTVFALLIILTIIFEMLNNRLRKMDHNTYWGAGALGFLLLAFNIWHFSLTGGMCCNPTSIIQGHAIWHLLDAVSVYCLFRFYVSEQPLSSGKHLQHQPVHH